MTFIWGLSQMIRIHFLRCCLFPVKTHTASLCVWKHNIFIFHAPSKNPSEYSMCYEEECRCFPLTLNNPKPQAAFQQIIPTSFNCCSFPTAWTCFPFSEAIMSHISASLGGNSDYLSRLYFDAKLHVRHIPKINPGAVGNGSSWTDQSSLPPQTPNTTLNCLT